MVQRVFYSSKHLILSWRLCCTYGKLLPRPTRLHPAWRTQAPPTPPSRAPRPPRWELSTVPPRPTIYSNRVGIDPDLPLTRLPVHNPPDCFHSVPLRNVFDLLRYIARSYVYRIPNWITCLLHLQFRNTCW